MNQYDAIIVFLVAVFSRSPNCRHPTAHPHQRQGAVRYSVPQGKRRITAQMTATINKYIRKRDKRKLLAVREYSLLCEICLAKEQRRIFDLENARCLLSQPLRPDTRHNYIIPQSVCEKIQQTFADF